MIITPPYLEQITKVIELHEQMHQRCGVVIVGPSGCGKSTLLRLLRGGLTRLGQGPTVVFAFNPKSMPRTHLLGRVDVDTREWTDGVLTHAARSLARLGPGKWE
ncbi:unnamed protein product [Protopolystoma xenopodis]|uniref:ATPase dynein-related AAA domain-containing protein n=1 Tax=Protopolystoma xenopodis TaxID=117903 RepID=A0A448X1S1_9PLAT|nr:unnamed protein product [Protopolystoma xenopodis]